MTTYPSATERFWGQLSKHLHKLRCWNWRGATSHGYGIINVSGRKEYAHRLSLTIHKRKIRAGYVVDHLCSNRRCVNPAHLEVVTFGENARRGVLSATRARRIQKGLYVP